MAAPAFTIRRTSGSRCNTRPRSRRRKTWAASSSPIATARRSSSNRVADLKTGNHPFIGEGVIQDEAGLFVVVEKFPWANTLEVTHEVEKRWRHSGRAFPASRSSRTSFGPATFIEIALANLRFAMILGCVLVSLILIAFLFEWRTAVISLTAIPLSIVSARHHPRADEHHDQHDGARRPGDRGRRSRR